MTFRKTASLISPGIKECCSHQGIFPGIPDAGKLETVRQAKIPVNRKEVSLWRYPHRGVSFLPARPCLSLWPLPHELGSLRPADTVTVNQMYVDYMLPPDGRRKTPVVMVHGAGLSGSCYDTTPDGRMGWYEYFVRNAHPVYVVDQIGRGR